MLETSYLNNLVKRGQKLVYDNSKKMLGTEEPNKIHKII